MTESSKPIYLDCNATTPLEPIVYDLMRRFLEEEYGNAGSRTHEFGSRAKQAVQLARDQVAAVVHARREEVIFTSGATEANNLAILGLRLYGESVGKRHVIASTIEHKAVLEPIEQLESLGFEVTWVECDRDGVVSADAVANALRDDTLLVSVMAANNETGVRQPLTQITDCLSGHSAYFHVDAAQMFGKELQPLRNPRIDFLSVSGHKIYAPKGVGALIARRRGYSKSPLRPLMFGGGQERGLRPGTLPVALVAALGKAAELSVRENECRRKRCLVIKDAALKAFSDLKPRYHGRTEQNMDHVMNLAIPGLDSEALMVALKDVVAISNGSACTSSSYTPSHVIKAMGYSDDEANEAIRISWCHMTPEVDWEEITERIRQLR